MKDIEASRSNNKLAEGDDPDTVFITDSCNVLCQNLKTGKIDKVIDFCKLLIVNNDLICSNILIT